MAQSNSESSNSVNNSEILEMRAGASCGQLLARDYACPDPNEKLAEASLIDFTHRPNRLASSSSPYLLQHAHNPVDWYPWGSEAFECARREDKPIFLSVGYSTCYWCHVMEREVFESEQIARLMNDACVCIKVDREERPDLDETYMAATQLLTRHGGWPNSVFLTHDLKPFFAGTYFGAEDSPGRPGFPTVLAQLSAAWTQRRAAIEELAARVAQGIASMIQGDRRESGAVDDGAILNATISQRAVAQLQSMFDRVNGGFAVAPKFPNDFYHSFLLEAGGEAGLQMVTTTLDAMAAGGIHDQVGGGFHRYSVDGEWHVPHFEKMLYNQAMLTRAFVDAYAATGHQRYRDVALNVLRFVADVFTDADGKFFSALDAETEAVEGAYYAWTNDEIARVLGDDDSQWFAHHYRVVPIPVFPGHKHPDGGALIAARRGTKQDARARELLARLALYRRGRTLPRLDDKSIAAWNGMMIDAYAHAGSVLGEPAFVESARRAATSVLGRLVDSSGTLSRSVRGDSAASHPGFLEDYAWVVRGLLTLARAEESAPEKQRWIALATTLEARAEVLLWDGDRGGFFDAGVDEHLIARSKSASDGAPPSGNSVMAHALLDLAELTGNARYLDRVDKLFRAFAEPLAGSPASMVHMVHALERRLASGPIALTSTNS